MRRRTYLAYSPISLLSTAFGAKSVDNPPLRITNHPLVLYFAMQKTHKLPKIRRLIRQFKGQTRVLSVDTPSLPIRKPAVGPPFLRKNLSPLACA